MQRLVKTKSTSFLDSETEVDLLRVTQNLVIRCVNKMTFCMKKPVQYLIPVCF